MDLETTNPLLLLHPLGEAIGNAENLLKERCYFDDDIVHASQALDLAFSLFTNAVTKHLIRDEEPRD